MACREHFRFYDDCFACQANDAHYEAKAAQKQRAYDEERRHKERMRQARAASSDRDARPRAEAPRGPGGLSLGASVAVLLVPLMAGMALLMVLSAVAAAMTLLLQGVFAATVFGGLAGGGYYLIARRRNRGHQRIFTAPKSAGSPRDRVKTAYRSLDPVTRSALHVAAGVGAVAFLASALL